MSIAPSSTSTTPPVWPITLEDVRAAEARIRSHLGPPTPLREYAPLNQAVGHGIRVHVKHDNHLPTNAFKARNALAALTALSEEERARGVVAATRGNHGAGLAWAGQRLGTPVTICVPRGNNPEKNAAMVGHGATLVEEGADYDEAVAIAQRLVTTRGMTLVHSTNNPNVIAGAGTMTLEMLEQAPWLDALVMSVGGGSQVVGALTVVRALKPGLEVYGVQAHNASAACDSFHAGHMVTTPTADTFADGLATRSAYAVTFGAMKEGLEDFVTATEGELAAAVRLMIRSTHNLAEGAGAASLAGLLKLAPRLKDKRVAVVLSGSNIDQHALRRVMDGVI